MAPLLLLAAYLAITEVRRLRADLDRQARDLANSVAVAVDQDLQNRTGGLQMLVDMADTDPAKRPALYAQARSFLRTYGTHVVLTDAKMQMLFNTRVALGAGLPALSGSNGQRSAALALKTGQAAVSDILIGPVAGVPLVAISVRLLREDAAPLVLLTTLPTQMLADRLKNVPLPGAWSV